MALSSTAMTGCKQKSSAVPSPPKTLVKTVHYSRLELGARINGRVVGKIISTVRPRATGVIEDTLFTEGQFVTKGQPLFQIDPRLYQAELARAKGAILLAGARRNAVENRSRRENDLNKLKAVSTQDVEDTRAVGREVAANIQIGEAERLHAEVKNDFTLVRAPISGRIGRALILPGSLVVAEQGQALATILNDNEIYGDYELAATTYNRERNIIASTNGNLEPHIYIDGSYGNGPPVISSATVIDTNANSDTDSVVIRATLPNNRHQFIPGAFTSARYVMGYVNGTIEIPAEAIIRNDDGGERVCKVDVEKKVICIDIQVLERGKSTVWVLGDVADGDRVIVDNPENYSSGQKIDPIEGRLSTFRVPE